MSDIARPNSASNRLSDAMKATWARPEARARYEAGHSKYRVESGLDARREAILAAFDAGERIAAIAQRFGCSESYVSHLARRNKRPSRRSEADRAEMVRAARERASAELLRRLRRRSNAV